MHNFYDSMIERILNENFQFRISFEKRTLHIGGKSVDIPADEFSDWDIDSLVDELEYLFDGYYHSIPSERSERARTSYFVALPLNQLSDEDMECGLLREQARFALELFVLLNIVNGKFAEFPFRDERAFFWQPSDNHPLIVFRSWFVQP